MGAFDQAWDVVKYDEGYWQEIYEPIMRETPVWGICLSHLKHSILFPHRLLWMLCETKDKTKT